MQETEDPSRSDRTGETERHHPDDATVEPAQPHGTGGRHLARAARVLIGLVLLVLAGAGALLFLLLVDKVPLSALSPRIAASIERQLPPGYAIDIGDTLLRRSPRTGELTIQLTNLRVRQNDGTAIFAVPRAAVGLSVPALLTGRMSARSIRVIQPELTLIEGEDGLGLVAHPASSAAESVDDWTNTSVLDALALVFGMLKSDSGIATLQEVGVEDARLVVRREDREARALSPLTLLLKREAAPDTIGFEASLGEGTGAARIGGSLRQTAGRGVAVDVEMANLDARDFEPLLPASLPFEVTSALQGSVAIELSSAGEVDTLSFDLVVGAGFFGVTGGQKLLVDEMTIAADWNRRAGRLRIHPSTILAGENRGTLSGDVVVPRRGDFGYGTWPVRLELTNVRLDDAEAGWPAVFPLVSIEAFYLRAPNLLNISRLDIASPEAAASLVGVIGGGRESPGVRLAGSSAPIPVRALKSLWPPFLGTGARNWMVENLHEGLVTNTRVTIDIRPEEIASAIRGKPLPERAYQIDFEMEDASFSYLGDMPPVTGADATASLKPATFDLKLTDTAKVDVGQGEIVVKGGRFFVGDLRPKPAIGEINLSLAGPAQAVAELLNYEPLQLPARRGIDPRDLGGSADVDVGLVMPLAPDVRFADVDVTAGGVVTALSGDSLVDGHSVTDGDVSFSIADRWISIEGRAEIDGVRADLALRQPFEEGDGDAARTITMTLDEAAQARLGLKLGGLLTGPVQATVKDIAATEKGGAQRIEVDLTSARLQLPQLGLDKPAGRAAKAEFLLSQQSDSVSIEDLTLVSEGMRIDGKVEVDRAGQLVDLSFPVFRLPNGTDLAVTGRSEGGRRVFALKGSQLDLRPAIASAKSASGGESGASQPISVKIDVKRAVGQNQVSIQDLIGSVSIGSSGIDAVDLSGRVGAGASVTASYRSQGSPALTVRSGDAGAVIAFAGVYPHMRGGSLTVNAERQGLSGALTGRVMVDRFAIMEDPAVKRLIATGEQSGHQAGSERVDAIQPARPDALVDPGHVRLDRIEAQFALLNGRLDIRNGVIRGAAVGATVEGQIALRDRRLDLHGTYVPLYAINNLFQRLPVFGVLLGGKRNEGLLGITYSLRGSLASPDLSINPLSVVTPGVFRHIFQMDNPRSGAMPDRDYTRSQPLR